MKRIALLLIAITLAASAFAQKKFVVTIPYDMNLELKHYPINMLMKKMHPNSDQSDLYAQPEVFYRYGENETLDYKISDIVYKDLTCAIKWSSNSYTGTTWADTVVIVGIDGYKYKSQERPKLSNFRQSTPFYTKWNKVKKAQETFDKSKKEYLEYAKWQAEMDEKAEYKRIQDSIQVAEANAAELRRQEEERVQKIEAEKAARRRIFGDLETEFTEPTSPIKTRSSTWGGETRTYEYYINENGYEVKHGKETVTITYKNYKYRTEVDVWWINGTEKMTAHYRNGILHGKFTYECKTDIDAILGNDKERNVSYDFDIYKGFLTGDFKFSYKGIEYTGRAINGILEHCEYRTIQGFHGNIESDPNGKTVSISKVDNGSGLGLGELSTIFLNGLTFTMPNFRFPLTGK